MLELFALLQWEIFIPLGSEVCSRVSEATWAASCVIEADCFVALACFSTSKGDPVTIGVEE